MGPGESQGTRPAMRHRTQPWMSCVVTSRRLPRALLLLLLLGSGMAAWISAGPHFGWGVLARHQDSLRQLVSTYPVAAPLVYVLAYVLTAALSLPQATLLTVTGGLLFGPMFGATLTVIGATIGASILLVVARNAMGDALTRRGGRPVAAARAELQQDRFAILLALRLLPLFPFWAVNLAAAAAGMRLTAFVPATALGIAPACFIFSSIGAGVGEVLAAGRAPDMSALAAPRVLLPLLGLAALSLLSVVWRRWRAAHG
jgi:uncharacterized membrane protein YdjX (TVP38/TMEM64 family)